MAVHVWLIKRKLKSKGRGGRAKQIYAMRWLDPESGRTCFETCATSDGVQAEALRRLKWQELNGLADCDDEPEPVQLPSWGECREAFHKAMIADNLRPSSIAKSLLLFDKLQGMFPRVSSPGALTCDQANDYKRRRAAQTPSPWTIRGELTTLKAVFGKWLCRECGLLSENPFRNVKAPKCDEPAIRIVSASESTALFAWLNERWNHWRLPIVYLQIAALVGWRATEIASIKTDDLLSDGYIRVASGTSKTRKHKYAWLPDDLWNELAACADGGLVFGRFSSGLREILKTFRKQPHHAAMVKSFTPRRLVGWMQDELQRFNGDQEAAVVKAKKQGKFMPEWIAFTLHDFRRTAITGLQMAGVTEKEASVMVGATPEVIRRHYEKLDAMAIARRSVERRLTAQPEQIQQLLRAYSARNEKDPLDKADNRVQTVEE